MDEFEIECNECGWQGYTCELHAKTELINDRDFNYCPDCGSDNIEDIDNEDE